jgi:hypothetical protein
VSQVDKLVGGVGTVMVGTLEVTITPLSVIDERILDRKLLKAAQAAADDPYTEAAKTLKAAEANPAHLHVLLMEVAAIATRKKFLSVGEFDDYRRSPAGVATEIFARGHKATPGLAAKELAAVITEFNAEEIHEAMKEVIANKGGSDDEKKATP